MSSSRAGFAIAALVTAIGCAAIAAPATDAAAVPPSTYESPASARWTWPITPPRVTAPFVAPAGPYAAGHRGIDIAVGPGGAVLAPTGGTLTVAQTVVDRPVVTIAVGEHVLVSMEPVAATVPLASAVSAGEPVGIVATGGHCDAQCVHLGVRVDGEYVSPLLFLADVPPAVLMPLEPGTR